MCRRSDFGVSIPWDSILLFGQTKSIHPQSYSRCFPKNKFESHFFHSKIENFHSENSELCFQINSSAFRAVYFWLSFVCFMWAKLAMFWPIYRERFSIGINSNVWLSYGTNWALHSYMNKLKFKSKDKYIQDQN